MSGGAVGQVVASRNERVPEGSWVTNWLGWRELALSDGRGLMPVDPVRRARLDGARRARDAGPDRVGRAARHRPAGGGGDGLRLRGSGRSRLARGADREAEGLPRDRQRRLAREGRVAARSSGSTRRSTTARPTRARRCGRASTCTSTTSAARRSRWRSRRCASTAASSPAARSRSTTPRSGRRGRETCPTSSRSGCASRGSS